MAKTLRNSLREIKFPDKKNVKEAVGRGIVQGKILKSVL